MKVLVYTLVALICLLNASCSTAVYYDAKNDKYATNGDFVYLAKKKNTPISISTRDCCGDSVFSVEQVGDKAPALWGTNQVYVGAGEVKIIIVAKDRRRTFLPTFYIAFKFEGTEEMDLQLVEDGSGGFRLVDKEKDISFHGEVFSPEKVSEAYERLALTIAPANQYMPPPGVETLYSLGTQPKPIFSLRPMAAFHHSGDVAVHYDLDINGCPVHIVAEGGEDDLVGIARQTLASARFQRTKLNGKYVERKNLVLVFPFKFSVTFR